MEQLQKQVRLLRMAVIVLFVICGMLTFSAFMINNDHDHLHEFVNEHMRGHAYK